MIAKAIGGRLARRRGVFHAREFHVPGPASENRTKSGLPPPLCPALRILAALQRLRSCVGSIGGSWGGPARAVPGSGAVRSRPPRRGHGGGTRPRKVITVTAQLGLTGQAGPAGQAGGQARRPVRDALPGDRGSDAVAAGAPLAGVSAPHRAQGRSSGWGGYLWPWSWRRDVRVASVPASGRGTLTRAVFPDRRCIGER